MNHIVITKYSEQLDENKELFNEDNNDSIINDFDIFKLNNPKLPPLPDFSDIDDKKLEQAQEKIVDLQNQVSELSNLVFETAKLVNSGLGELYIIKKKLLPETFILQDVKYIKEEDEYVNKFCWELANQCEKEKYIKIVNEKYLLNMYYHDDDFEKDDVKNTKIHKKRVFPFKLVKREPLILTKIGNNCNIRGWVNIGKLIRSGMQYTTYEGTNTLIILPSNTGIYSHNDRYIYRSSATNFILSKNKISLNRCIISDSILFLFKINAKIPHILLITFYFYIFIFLYLRK